MRNLQGYVRRLVSARPFVYYALTCSNPRNRRVRTTHDCDLVIEGFPRSGNSFALHATLHAQSTELRVAHHLHAPAQVIRASRLGLPCLVLIRKPSDAVASLVIRDPAMPPERALRDYCHFYASIKPYRSSIVVADFEDVIRDFGTVIQRVNERFGTSFVPFRHTEENVAAVFQKLEEVNRRLGDGLETQVARPSAARRTMQRDIKARLEASPTALSQLEHADAIYEAFMRPGAE